MNLSELRQLQDGDKVIFQAQGEKEMFFTNNKEYIAKKKGTGMMVYNDNGMGRFLNDIKECFEKAV